MEHKKFIYKVDGESQETTKKVLTPTEILQNAGIDVKTHYLVEIKGNHQDSYKDEPDKILHMHTKMEFLSMYRSATTVACGGADNYG